MKTRHQEIQKLLDKIRDAGIGQIELAEILKLHQVNANARSIRHWYSGKTHVREVEFRALRDFINQNNL